MNLFVCLESFTNSDVRRLCLRFVPCLDLSFKIMTKHDILRLCYVNITARKFYWLLICFKNHFI
jgi:hypothetical protein